MPHGTLKGYPLRGHPSEPPPRRDGKVLLGYQLGSQARKHSTTQRLPGIKKKFVELARLAAVEGMLMVYDQDSDTYHLVTTADTFVDTVTLARRMLRQIEILLEVQERATGGRMADTVQQDQEADMLNRDRDDEDEDAVDDVERELQRERARELAVQQMWKLRGRLHIVHPCQYEDELFRTQQSGKQREAAARGGTTTGTVSGLPSEMAGREMWLPTNCTKAAVERLSATTLHEYERHLGRRDNGTPRTLSEYARQCLAKDDYSQRYCRPSPFSFPLFSRVVGLRQRHPGGELAALSDVPLAFQEPSLWTIDRERHQRVWVEDDNKRPKKGAPPPAPARDEYEHDPILGETPLLVRRPVRDVITGDKLYTSDGVPRTEVLVGPVPQAVRARSYRRLTRTLDEMLRDVAAPPKRGVATAAAAVKHEGSPGAPSAAETPPPVKRRTRTARTGFVPVKHESPPALVSTPTAVTVDHYTEALAAIADEIAQSGGEHVLRFPPHVSPVT